MRRQFWVALIAANIAVWAGAAIPGSAAMADPVYPPGLRVGLEPPGDLVLSKQFSGFEDPDRKVAITILDLPARAYEDIERAVFGPNQQGLTDIKRESFPFAGGFGFLISGQAAVNGVGVHKWFLLANVFGKDLALLVNFEVPEAARAIYTDAVVRKALASVSVRTPPMQELLGLLPFKFNEFAGFRVLQALPGGVILTDGPADDVTKQPYMIISIGPGGPSDPDERVKFSRELLASAPLRDIAVTAADPMRIGGSQGFEIRARAMGLDGQPVSLVQWIRFGSGGFLRIIGVSRNADSDELFTRFRAVRDGIEMK